MLDSTGRVVGIAFASFSGGQNLNFAIPTSYLQQLLQAREPLRSLAAAKPTRPVRSILAEIGETAVEGTEVGSFLWSDSLSPDGKFTVSIRNKLRQAIRDVTALVIFSDGDGKALDNVEIRFEGLIGAGLAKRAMGSTDPSVHRITEKAQATLARVNSELARNKAEMQAASAAARAEIARKDAQITQLTTETNQLTLKMDDLTSSIDKLGQQIASTERKLAASEGDREFLFKELKRLQAEKAELERQFNDLAILRTQVARLKEELTVARRLEWVRIGIHGVQDKNGAELLIANNNPNAKTNEFNLNIELKQDGGADLPARRPVVSQSATTVTNLIQFRVLSFELAEQPFPALLSAAGEFLLRLQHL